MTLGFSRHMAVRIVFDQKVETWLRLHIECFEELGGVPKTIVPDNLKAPCVRVVAASSSTRTQGPLPMRSIGRAGFESLPVGEGAPHGGRELSTSFPGGAE